MIQAESEDAYEKILGAFSKLGVPQTTRYKGVGSSKSSS